MANCAICGNEFAGKRSDAKYCSPKCKRVGEKSALLMRACERCGKEFKIDKPGRKYCSRDCFYASSVGHPSYVEMKRVTKNCVVCGTKFQSGGQLREKSYCSWECRYKGRYYKGKQAKELSPIDAAYIAGFTDGEGALILFAHRDTVAIRISIANTNKEILDWICEVTGVGNVSLKKMPNIKHKDCYTWHCNSGSAESVIKQIRPYLKIKTRQADLMVEFQEKLRNPALKADRSWQMEALKLNKSWNVRGPQVDTVSFTAGG